ncbi:MAG: hypothetical protein LBH85_02235 [Treponema sp.]|jgi:integrase|nr:hypothetical protein [Treponema sp.]
MAPFDMAMQEAVKKLWEENGRHEFAFTFKNGKTPSPSWIKRRFKKWMIRAGVELNGRKIVPHSSRHSLAFLLEARGCLFGISKICSVILTSRPQKFTSIPLMSRSETSEKKLRR